eukprot:5492216-Alexandrium_andersonii.AAC.1
MLRALKEIQRRAPRTSADVDPAGANVPRLRPRPGRPRTPGLRRPAHPHQSSREWSSDRWATASRCPYRARTPLRYR